MQQTLRSIICLLAVAVVAPTNTFAQNATRPPNIVIILGPPLPFVAIYEAREGSESSMERSAGRARVRHHHAPAYHDHPHVVGQ